MTVLALIGIKVALNTITSTVSLMTDYYVLTDREIKHLKVWNHKTSLPPSFFLTFVFIEMLAATYGVSWLCMSKRGVCTDIDSINHSVTDKFVTGLQIAVYLTYMRCHDSWKELWYEYSPILYRISCISLGRGSRGNRYFLYNDIYRSAIVVQISFCKTCIVNPYQLEKRNNFD